MRVSALRGESSMGMGPNRIKLLRTRRGLSQEEFAKLAGMTIETLSRLENDRGPMPRATSVRKVAQALGVEALDLWLTPEDARAAVNAVADGRVKVEEPEEEPQPAIQESPQAQAPSPPPAAPDSAPGPSEAQTAPPASPPAPSVPADRVAARESAAVAYGVSPPTEPAAASPRRGMELPPRPPDVTEAARTFAREELFPQLPTDIDDAEQMIEVAVDTVAQWIFDNNEDDEVPSGVLRWLMFAWLARVVAPDEIRAGATDPVDRSDVTNAPRTLLLAYDRADRIIGERIQEAAQ
jgi:transcriptional regulator with XRE-family HTH domain